MHFAVLLANIYTQLIAQYTQLRLFIDTDTGNRLLRIITKKHDMNHATFSAITTELTALINRLTTI